MGLEVNVQIRSGSNIGGRFPFIVVCFDDDLSNEVYKTSSAPGGRQVIWNDAFTLDLKTHFKSMLTDGKKEPAYMTFFIFDNGVQGNPSLGSAGVRLSLVREHGKAEGDFPVVNGEGTLNLSVEGEKTRFDWLYSDKAKIAAGAVGISAVAAGLTAVALNQRKKKNSAAERDEDPERNRYNEGGERKKKMFDISKIPGLRALAGDDHGSSSDEGGIDERRLYREERYEPRPDSRNDSNSMVAPPGVRDVAHRRVVKQREIMPRGASRDVGRRESTHYEAAHGPNYTQARGGANYTAPQPHVTSPPQLGPHERPWWLEVDESDEDNAAPGYTRPAGPARPTAKPAYPPAATYEERSEEPPASVHIHYHDGGNANTRGDKDGFEGDNREIDPGHQTVHVRVQEPNRTSEYIEDRRVSDLPEDLNQAPRSSQNNPYI